MQEVRTADREEAAGSDGDSVRPLLSSMTETLDVLEERRKYLAVRIEAKKAVEWDTEWDEREHAALSLAVFLFRDAIRRGQ